MNLIKLEEYIKIGDFCLFHYDLPNYMNYKQYVSYAVFCAEQVIDVFERQYPHIRSAKNAICAAKKCIENESDENKENALRCSDDAIECRFVKDIEAEEAASCAINCAHLASGEFMPLRDEGFRLYFCFGASVNAGGDAIKMTNYGLSLIKENENN